jgi:hypothetical protein
MHLLLVGLAALSLALYPNSPAYALPPGCYPDSPCAFVDRIKQLFRDVEQRIDDVYSGAGAERERAERAYRAAECEARRAKLEREGSPLAKQDFVLKDSAGKVILRCDRPLSEEEKAAQARRGAWFWVGVLLLIVLWVVVRKKMKARKASTESLRG